MGSKAWNPILIETSDIFRLFRLIGLLRNRFTGCSLFVNFGPDKQELELHLK